MRRIRGRDIAMVFQEPMTSLNPVLSIGRQSPSPWKFIWYAYRPARQRAVELLTLVGIPDAAHQLARYPHHFSGGMRQRS